MATFKAPQKKKFQPKEGYYSPLPIPIASITKNSPSCTTWNFYEGVLEGSHVTVKCSGDATSLYSQGCFGKLIEAAESLYTGSSNNATFHDKDGYYDKNECGTSSMVETFSSGQCTGNIQLSKDESQEDLEVSHERDSIITDNLDIALFEKSILHLSCEESFFLSYALGCLFVKCNGESLNIQQQWKSYCDLNERFPVTYAVYHYFRSKGWVPRDGIRYGADLILYRKGPAFYHASYMVVIQTVNANTLQTCSFNGIGNRIFSWGSLSGLLRLATTVSKEVLICYVLLPNDFDLSEQVSPKCLEKLQINESICSRWVSSKERDKELLDIDCEF